MKDPTQSATFATRIVQCWDKSHLQAQKLRLNTAFAAALAAKLPGTPT